MFKVGDKVRFKEYPEGIPDRIGILYTYPTMKQIMKDGGEYYIKEINWDGNVSFSQCHCMFSWPPEALEKVEEKTDNATGGDLIEFPTRELEDMNKTLIREFVTGASRDSDEGKLDYEGFISPLVEKRYAEYMHKNRIMSDGSLRSSDNWQRGLPVEQTMKSLCRHFQDLRLIHDGFSEQAVDPDIQSVLCAIRFNVDSILFEYLKEEIND